MKSYLEDEVFAYAKIVEVRHRRTLSANDRFNLRAI